MERALRIVATAAIALLLVWIGFRERGAESTLRNPTHETGSQAALEPERNDAPDSAARDLQPLTSGAQGSDQRREAVLLEPFDLERARWVRGRVLLPPDLPADEELFVVATEGRSDAGPMGLGLEPQEDAARLLSRAPVDSAGDFELPVPEDLDEVHVGVRGHYLYSERSTPVQLPDSEALTLQPLLGAWIVGVVDASDSSDDYVARLSIDAEGVANMFDGSAWAVRETHADGTQFQFEGVATRNPLRALALSKSAPAAISERLEVHAGQRLELQLTPGPGGTIHGTVLDGSGEPFPEVTVFALDDANFLAGRTGRRVRETLTDSLGHFTLSGVVAGAMSVRAERPDYLVVSERVDLDAGQVIESIELVLTRGRSITGRVVGPDGIGRENARVSAVFDVGTLGGIQGLYAVRGNMQNTTTGEDGAFVLSGLGRGPFTVSASWLPENRDVQELEPDERARQAFSARTGRVDPGGAPLEIRLVPPTVLRGVVQKLDGTPATEFQVQASHSSESLVLDFGKEIVQRDFESADGSFELWGVRPGTWQVQVGAPGHAPTESMTVSVPQPTGAAPLVFVLQPESTVAGRVLLPDGSPAEGASISVSRNSLERMSKVYNALGEDTATSDAQGAFRLERRPAGPLVLVARAKNFAESVPLEVQLSAGLELDDVLLQLRRGATITGEVYAKDGTPAVGDAIILQIPGSQEMRQTSSDKLGHFRFDELPPASWQVIAMPNEDRIAQALEQEDSGFGSLIAGVRMGNVDLKEGDEQHVVLGEPLPDPVRVFGRVTLDGKGVPGAVVSFVDGTSDSGSVRFESADSQGRYELALPSAGTYVMLVQRMGEVMAETSLEFRVQIPEAREHELDITIPLGRISGEVRGPNGDALRNARVSLVGADGRSQGFWGGQYTETKTDADGRYAVDWLRPGSYRVTAGGLRFGGLFGEPSPWGRGEGRVVTVAGVVRDANGLPVSGAAVFTYDARGQLVERLSFVTSEASGAFQVDALAPGDYSFLARHDGAASARSEALTVTSGALAKQDLQLSAGTLLEVDVRGPDGKPVQANVRVLDADGFEVSGAISFGQLSQALQGGFGRMLRQIGPLAPGRYVVSASVPGLGSAERKVTLRGRPSKHTTLRLK